MCEQYVFSSHSRSFESWSTLSISVFLHGTCLYVSPCATAVLHNVVVRVVHHFNFLRRLSRLMRLDERATVLIAKRSQQPLGAAASQNVEKFCERKAKGQACLKPVGAITLAVRLLECDIHVIPHCSELLGSQRQAWCLCTVRSLRYVCSKPESTTYPLNKPDRTSDRRRDRAARPETRVLDGIFSMQTGIQLSSFMDDSKSVRRSVQQPYECMN